MHPVSTVILLMGYGLALPILFRLSDLVASGNRLAFRGQQAGILIVIVGWLLRGSFMIALAHGLWLIGARIWFDHKTKKSAAQA